ncbi:phosphonate metabolism protein PhnP [Vibrio sp. STUT-A11]|uniref:phosphonate metabolism protein PhnP n=1 Tax=Vibrio sp. STUT-A11 TaxID=2976236 RepID=UPI002230DDC8|nr:phosphonate metabolism protein PhnP [Vibrio sp. STUT-A11]BDR16632.1 phosphonate metabolism protein PhnP [Vibrio sp. STUT-A11]
MRFTLLGTGNGAMLPVYGCGCKACTRAKENAQYRRNKTSAMVEHNGKTLLIDANLPDLMQRFPSGSIDRILLTHYHIDHVQSLFDLREGVGTPIPVHGPDDLLGCDNLYKYPGILKFQPPFSPFQTFEWQGISITTIPLNHSRTCLGYVFNWRGKRIAYLTDTYGLNDTAIRWFQDNPVEWMFIDCGYMPLDVRGNIATKNHSTFEQIEDIQRRCKPKHLRLLHISHTFETWAMDTFGYFSDLLDMAHDGQSIDYSG